MAAAAEAEVRLPYAVELQTAIMVRPDVLLLAVAQGAELRTRAGREEPLGREHLQAAHPER